MPKNKGKGGKNRRRGKNDNEDDKRELVFKTDFQGTSVAPPILPQAMGYSALLRCMFLLGRGEVVVFLSGYVSARYREAPRRGNLCAGGRGRKNGGRPHCCADDLRYPYLMLRMASRGATCRWVLENGIPRI